MQACTTAPCGAVSACHRGKSQECINIRKNIKIISTSGLMETRTEKGLTSDISTILRKEDSTPTRGMKITIASAAIAISMLSGCATVPMRDKAMVEPPAKVEHTAPAHAMATVGKITAKTDPAKSATGVVQKIKYPAPPKKTEWQQIRDFGLLGVIGYIVALSLG